MAGTNKNYTLGKGKVFFEPHVSGVTPGQGGEMYFAQTPELSYNVKADTVDHYDADEGLNTLDEQVTTKVDITGKFTSEDITSEKISFFFLSGASSKTIVTSASAIVDTFKAKLGRFFQLGRTAALPSGARNVSNVVLKKGTATLVEGTDYTVDLALARVYLLPSGVTVLDDDTITATFDVAAGTRDIVISSSNQIRGSLRFISSNPVGGQRDYYYPLVNLTPEGDYTLKGSDWQKIGFKFTALKSGTLERVYVDGRSVL